MPGRFGESYTAASILILNLYLYLLDVLLVMKGLGH